MITSAFAIAGVVVGLAQAGLLARAVGHRPHPLGFVLRLGLVAVVLVVAALRGQVLAAAAGWLLGFVVAVLVVQRRWR